MDFWSKDSKEYPMPVNKISCFYKGIKPASFDRFLMNIEKNSSMMKHVKELKVLERHEDGCPKLYYSRSKMTGMSEREAITK